MGGLYNPLGVGPSPDSSPAFRASQGMPPPPIQDGIPPAAPAPTGPTKDSSAKSNPNNGTKSDEVTTTEYEDRLRTFIAEKFQDLRTGYTVFHQLVWQNILFYVGMLWIQWDQNRRIWQPAVPEDEWTPQPKINNFSPAADAISSVFEMPTVEAIPRQEDNMLAHEVAEIANVLADYFVEQNALAHDFKTKEGKADNASQLFVLSGNVLSTVRRIKKGRRMVPHLGPQQQTLQQCPQCGYSNRLPIDPSSPESAPVLPCPQCGNPQLMSSPTTQWGPMQDALGQPVMDSEDTYTACCDILNPLFWLPRAGSQSQEDARYGFLARRMHLSEIKEEWNYDAQPNNEFLDSMESSWEIALNFYYTGYSSLTQSTKESALVVMAFIEPGKIPNLPEGGVGVYCNDILIFTYSWEDFCLPDEWPVTHAGYWKAPTTYFWRTPMHDVAEVQKETNRYESLIALHAMTSASDSLIIDENSRVTNITGRGDRIVRYRSLGPGTQPPHRLQHGSLDAGVYEQRQKLEDKIQNITGAVNVWRGQQAGSVTAAGAISQLRGQAEQMFSKPTNNYRYFWVESVRKGVKLLQKIMAPWEISLLMGEGHDVQILKFMSADLDSTLEWVATSHGLPRTRDEKRNDMLALFDRGALDVSDPNVRIRINELFGETGMERMFNKDATRARSENDRMKKGEEVKPMFDIEDLAVHFYVHSEFIKSLDFDNLSPEIQTIIIQHALETKMGLDMLAQKAAAAGAPPAPEGGGAPNGPPSKGPKGEGGANAGGHPTGGSGRPGAPAPGGPPKPKAKPKAPGPGRPGPTNMTAAPTGPGAGTR